MRKDGEKEGGDEVFVLVKVDNVRELYIVGTYIHIVGTYIHVGTYIWVVFECCVACGDGSGFI